jgi:hypothetical protein
MFVWSGSAWGGISSTAALFRFRFTAAGGETSESGVDDNGNTLSYLTGKEQVYLNGVLLVRAQDYTATNGTSIDSLSPALAASDVLEVITFTAFDVATAIPNSLFDAKGDILVATSADTPGKLTLGTNETRLVVDSGQTTGLKYVADTTNYAIAAKGDLLVGTAADTLAALTVGANGTTLVADSGETTGLKYVAGVPIAFNAQTAAYTLVAGDAFKLVTVSDTVSRTVTVPPSVFTAGQIINVQRIGTGAVPFAAGVGVTITSTGATSAAPTLRAQFSAASIVCTASNVFTILGDIS